MPGTLAHWQPRTAPPSPRSLGPDHPAMARAISHPSPFEESRASRPDARIELVQRGRVAMLGEVYLPRNREPVFDPRPQRGSVVVALTAEALAPFENGPATLRASALGRPQWLRTPPPTIREQAVTVTRP